MAAATDDERLAIRHLLVRRQERTKKRAHKETREISFLSPVVHFRKESVAENDISVATLSMR